ncbi:MAG: TIGR01777 family protein [Ignavibacteriales bacterium]|nr:TIGR01777 family protein [Ignavibacteriales bacterium]MCB9260114.1 TIGR01777 family protein [Ignavibacteriales bacterium]
MTKVLITGASGLIGSGLSKKLIAINFQVNHLSRSKKNIPNVSTFIWDLNKKEIDANSLKNVDVIIHLAGAGIAEKRWTDQRKKEIIDSRVESANLLYNEISKLDSKPKVFISASAIGYYGAVTSDKTFVESDPHANDFQGTVCKLWEESSKQFENLGLRTVQLRFGVVLSEKGGALEKMMLPTKFGIGSALGSGKQIIPWIHIDDVINIILESIKDENMSGTYNVVAPSKNNYNEFTKTLAKVMNKPFFMPNVPAFVLKLALGEMSEIVLEGSHISSEKIIQSGYEFKYPDLTKAFENLIK